MSKLDHITLSRISALHIHVNHIIHPAIEDNTHVSPSMDKFLSSGYKTVSATLGSKTPSVKEYDTTLPNHEKRNIQSQIFGAFFDGIILNIQTPIRFASKDDDDWSTSSWGNTVDFWFYGEDYDEALLKALVHIEDFHKASISLDLHPKSNTLLTKIANIFK
jgi:hypothetical protein